MVVVEGPEERDGAVEVGDEGDEAAKGDNDGKETVEEGEGEEGEIADEREEKEEETEPSCFGRKGRRRRFSSCSCCCPLTEVSLVALGTGAALVLAGATGDDEVELGVGMLRVTPTAPQTCWAKASVTGGTKKERGGRLSATDVRISVIRREEKGGGGLLCWSATEQTFSIRPCSEVTNCELPQMQAKSEMAQPVADMPACVADDLGEIRC